MGTQVFELLSQEECAKRVVAEASFYIEKGASKLVESARRYLAALGACKYPSLQMDRWVPSGRKFWREFEAYLGRESDF